MLGVFWAFFLNKGHLVRESAVLKMNRQIGNFFGGDMFFFPGACQKNETHNVCLTFFGIKCNIQNSALFLPCLYTFVSSIRRSQPNRLDPTTPKPKPRNVWNWKNQQPEEEKNMSFSAQKQYQETIRNDGHNRLLSKKNMLGVFRAKRS